jgi:zinc protease
MKLSVGRSSALISLLVALGCHHEAPKPQPQPKAEAPDARYASLPTPLLRRPWAPPPVKKLALPNGQTLWLLKRESTPLFTLKVVLPRGAATDPVDKAGLTQLTADMLDEGAGPMGAIELSDAFDLISADFSSEVNVDATILTLNGLGETLERSLELLAYIVEAPTLSEAEFELRKDKHLAEAIARLDDPMQLLGDQLSTDLFAEGYAGPPADGTHRTLSRIQLSDVKKHAANLLAAEGAHFVLVGPVSEARALRLFGTYFSKWAGKSTLVPRGVAEVEPKKSVHIVPFPGATQTALGVVKRAGPALAPEYYRELVLNERLAGSFTGRINLNLREAKGYTYGVHSFFHRYRSSGMFGIVTNVHAEATAPSLVEIFGELNALCKARPLSQEERDDAVEGLLLGYPLRFENTQLIADQLVSLPLYDRPADFFRDWPGQVGAITRDDVQGATSPYCSDDYKVVLVGAPDVILPQLEKAGIAGTLLPSPAVPQVEPQGAPVHSSTKPR